MNVFADVDFDERNYLIPVTDNSGQERLLHTRACVPANVDSARAVIINHGSPPGGAVKRAQMRPYSCENEVAQWFLSRGFMVLSPMRRGYGDTGGTWDEAIGPCENPDFVHAGLETAKDIQAVVDFLPQITHAQSENVVVVGQSAGGWGTIAMNSVPHPLVTAIINMAGGRGGHQGPKEDQNCAPDLLEKAAGTFGKTATTPMLWIYAENDTYFAPQISNLLYQNFSSSGGVAKFILKPAPQSGSDGHTEFSDPGGTQIWGNDFEDYLSSIH